MAAPYGENQFIYGLHDPGGEHLLKDGNQAKGWVLVTEEIRANPSDQGGRGDFYKRLADQGFGVIVRLNHAYGHDGTIPLQARYRDFAQRAANFVRSSPGAHIWIIGNEMNFEREQPRLSPGNSQAERITPRRYAECYKLCRNAIKSLSGHENDQVVVGAIGPWNGETPYEADSQGVYQANKLSGAPGQYPYNGSWGDYIQYLRDLLKAIGRENCDAIAIHAYSHGYDPNQVFNDQRMNAPFQDYHFHFRTYKDQMNAIPAEFRDLPVYLTEANGDVDPGEVRWPDVNSGWIKNAYREINDWNQAGNQQIRCVILYRWSRDDDWHIDGKGQVQQDLREAIAKNYQWNPELPATVTTQAATPAAQQFSVMMSGGPRYRTRFLSNNMPATLSPSQTATISFVIQNAGSDTWTTGGNTPYHLGFQWYNAQGQMVQFPNQLNYRTPLPNDVPPQGQVTLSARLQTPDAPGTYYLRWDMIQEGVTWFTTQGDEGLLISPMTIQQAVASTTTPATSTAVQPVASSALRINDVSASLTQSTTNSYPRRQRSAINRIILHHTATSPAISVQRIAQYQVNNRNLPGITYHYCVTDQGLIYQSQPLEVVSRHAGDQYSPNSVGVCLIGNFTDAVPPSPQLSSTASLLAYLVAELGLSLDQVFGYSDLVVTGSPGATWSTWRSPLFSQVDHLMSSGATTAPSAAISTATPAATTQKTMRHYMLFWHKGREGWAAWDLWGAFDYIAVFAPTLGFSVEQAKQAQYVTIVGGTEGVPATAEAELRAAGCQVGRVAGHDEAATRAMLQQLAAQGRRF